MAAKIRVVMPNGEQVHANFPVDAEAWSVEDGRRFFADLLWKAFPYQPEPGRRLNVRMSVEHGPGGVVVAVSITTKMQMMMRRFSKTNHTMTIGPFNFPWWRIGVANRPMTSKRDALEPRPSVHLARLVVTSQR